MNEEFIIDYFNDTFTAKNLAILLNSGMTRNSHGWEESKDKHLVVSEKHLKKIFDDYSKGELNAQHLKFLGIILLGRPRHGAEINEPYTFTYNQSIANIVYELSVLNTMTPLLGKTKLIDLMNLLQDLQD